METVQKQANVFYEEVYQDYHPWLEDWSNLMSKAKKNMQFLFRYLLFILFTILLAGKRKVLFDKNAGLS